MALSACAGATAAADKPLYQAPSAWVKLAAPPQAQPAGADGQAMRILLQDEQVRLGPGGVENYSDIVAQIQTPQGLQVAGNLAFAWDPTTDTPIIHRLRIIRDGQVIDLLAKGDAFTVLRRETNLERAMLDGTLTAAIQPEDLRVGDLIELAVSIRRLDPVMAGHVETSEVVDRSAPPSRLLLRAVWPAGARMNWGEGPTAPPATVNPTPAGQELIVDASNLPSLTPPRAAPARYVRSGWIDVTDFSDWSQVSALMQPLYARAATLGPNSPLKAEAAKIRATSSDPKAQAAATLRLVQDRVRYLFLGMNAGGYTPAPADTTWSRLFGDCKGKTVLLLALLHELGIEAQPALVSTVYGDGLDARKPMVALFDHVLVRAVVGGKVYWLDGTRLGDRDLDHLQTPNFGWALPVQASGAKLEKLVVLPLAEPAIERTIRLDASAGLDLAAPAHAEIVFRGDAATAMKLAMENVTPAQRDQSMRDYWKQQYDFIEVKQTSVAFDEKTGEAKGTMDGAAKMDWAAGTDRARVYETDGSTIGWKADFSRDPGPDSEAPFAIDFPGWQRNTEVILLPHGGAGFSVTGADVDKTLAGYELKRTSKIDHGVFTTTASSRSLVPEVGASEGRAAQAELRSLASSTVYVRAPANYAPTDREKGRQNSAATVSALINQGYTLQSRNDLDGALAAYDRALAIDPNAAEAVASRGGVLFEKGDEVGAQAAFDRALQLDPRQMTALMGKGRVHFAHGRWQDAIDTYNQVLALSPNFSNVIVLRGAAYGALGKPAEAAADYDQAIKLDPKSSWAWAARGQFKLFRGDAPGATADLDRAIALNPYIPGAYQARGYILRGQGHLPEALAALDRAVELAPREPSAIALRGLIHGMMGQNDLATADFDKALQLDPSQPDALQGRGVLLMRAGKHQEAIAALTAALAARPGDMNLLIVRAGAFETTHQLDLARADVDLAVKLHPAALEPGVALAFLLGKTGDFAGQADEYAKLILLEPKNLGLRQAHAYALAKAQRYEEGLKEEDLIVATNPSNPTLLNNRCWYKATAGRDLDSALVDCDAAVAGSHQDPEIIDSRAMVELKLGRFDRAIADYDIVISKRPNIAGSWFCRGVAKLRVGDAKDAEADIAHAKTIDAHVAEEYAGYGVVP